MKDLEQILTKVQKPGRYIGEETNIVRKGFSPDRTSVLLAYPDTYEVGMSYLGLKILYHLLNEIESVTCERAFMPWGDMEEELTSSGMKLFSLESKTPLNEFDIVGFSLSYELTYTNVLSMLKTGGITLESKERGEGEPLVIAGGACSYNPEPMAAFIDAFIIGDGEEALPRFIESYKLIKKSKPDRRSLLASLAKLKNVYVPSLYEAEYSHGKFSRLKALTSEAPPQIEKAFVEDFENAYYPVKQIVPLVKIIHDRMVVEVMRGCPNRCRFCQASVINRPVRIRSRKRIRDLCKETYSFTGYERIGLLSLSSVNYPHLADLIKELNEDFKGKGVGLSVPSLRIDEAFYDLPKIISALRKTGLTFAPESASGKIREALGKNIDLAILEKSALCAFQNGWKRLKLYFMVGFPHEEEEDARRIVSLAREISELKKEVSKGAAEVKVSVNPFIPKPHTPFQWLGMRKVEDLSRMKEILLSSSSKKVHIEFHGLEQSLLEACLSRGDRRMSSVIYSAWKKGARLDSWGEFFDFSKWQDAFKENGIDMESYASRTYETGDELPWGHIASGAKKEFLIKEFEASGFNF